MNVNSEELARALVLLQVPGVGPGVARRLLEEFGSLEKLFSLPGSLLGRIPRHGKALQQGLQNAEYHQKAQRELQYQARHGIRMGLLGDGCFYPPLLDSAPTPPLCLFSLSDGEFPIPNAKCISIVGTRNASKYGRDFVQRFVRELAEFDRDIVIVSGLALGIDAEAHRAALACGLRTVGVLAHGLSTIYPAEHAQLAREVRAHGALVSEYFSDTRAERAMFLQRNRIIAGLSHATIIVESDIKGGAMSTAAFAFNSGREVFAVPGPVGLHTSAGCNRLIHDNRAVLLESVGDLVSEIQWLFDGATPPRNMRSREAKDTTQISHSGLFSQEPVVVAVYEPTEEERPLVEFIRSHQGTDLDTLYRSFGIPIGQFNSILLNLEFQGVIRRLPGGVLELNGV